MAGLRLRRFGGLLLSCRLVRVATMSGFPFDMLRAVSEVEPLIVGRSDASVGRRTGRPRRQKKKPLYVVVGGASGASFA